MTTNNTTESIVLWSCEPAPFQSLICFFLAAECLLGLSSLFMNCAATIASYYAQPLTINHRQSLGAISLNYALVSGVLLARASFLIFTVYTTCNTTVNTLNCKLQEFPLVFVYTQIPLLTLLLGLQFLRKSNGNAQQEITWTNACSVHQIFVSICAMFMALFFTGFDEELEQKYLRHCTVLRAIHQKEMVFWLLASLIILHSLGLFIWQIVVQKWSANRTEVYTVEISDLVCKVECISWLFILLTTGFIALYEYVVVEMDEMLVNVAYETILVLCPLILCFARSIIIFWCVVPVRFATQRLFPMTKRFLHFDY